MFTDSGTPTFVSIRVHLWHCSRGSDRSCGHTHKTVCDLRVREVLEFAFSRVIVGSAGPPEERDEVAVTNDFRLITRLQAVPAGTLRTRVNVPKSAVDRPWRRKFPGFRFTVHRQPKRRLAAESIQRFNSRIRELTRRP